MNKNIQVIEKQVPNRTNSLSVISIFKTIQGEGPYTGHSAIFIRLAGCNLQCPGCDTDYTRGRQMMHVSEVIDEIAELTCNFKTIKLIVITGGEPFRQDISNLCNTLIDLGYRVQIETNGTLPPSERLHYMVRIVCSPKTGKLNKEIAKRIDVFKYVMDHKSIDNEDGLPVLALNHSAHPRVARPPAEFKGPIYLQPMDSQNGLINRFNIQAVTKSCLKYGYILQLQIHKLIGVE